MRSEPLLLGCLLTCACVNGVSADEPSVEVGLENTTEMRTAAETNTQFTFGLL